MQHTAQAGMPRARSRWASPLTNNMYALLALLTGIIGAGFHLLPILESPSPLEMSALASTVSLVGTIAFLAAAYTLWTRRKTAMGAFITGTLIGFGYFAISLHWLGESVVPDPSMYSLRAALTALGAWTLQYPWWGLAFLVAHLVCRASSPMQRFLEPDALALRKRSLSGAMAFSFALSVADVLLGDFVFRIPLSPLSSTALDTIAEPIITYVGTHCATALLIASGAVLGVLASRHPRKALIGVPVAILALLLAPRPDLTPEIMDAGGSVYLTQPNPPSMFSLGLKGEPDPAGVRMQTIHASIDAGVSSGADLIVLPEAIVPYDLSARPDMIADLTSHLPSDTVLIAGFRRTTITTQPDGGFTADTYNTAYALNARGNVLYAYDKAHLVPFGEYMPELFFSLGFNVVAGAKIEPGTSLDVVTLPGFEPFSLLICYEAILSGPVTRETAGATWLLNTSSEEIFGKTLGARQILRYVRMRSLESGLPTLRSVVTGFTSVIGSDGRVMAYIPGHEAGGILTAIPPSRSTLFHDLGYFFLYAFWALTAFATIALRGPKEA